MTLTDNDDELIFEEDGDEEESRPIAPWKMMIVDMMWKISITSPV